MANTLSKQARKLESYSGNREYIKYVNDIYASKTTNITEKKMDKMLDEFIKRTGLNYDVNSLKVILRNDSAKERNESISKLLSEIDDINTSKSKAIHEQVGKPQLAEFTRKCNEITKKVANGTLSKKEANEQIKEQRELIIKNYKENNEVKKAAIVGTSSLSKIMLNELTALAYLNRYLHIQNDKDKPESEKKETKAKVNQWFKQRQPDVKNLGEDRAHAIHPQNIHELGLVPSFFILDLNKIQEQAKGTINQLDISVSTTKPSDLSTSPSILEQKKPKTSKGFFSSVASFFTSLPNRILPKPVITSQIMPLTVMPTHVTPTKPETGTLLPPTTQQWQPGIKPNPDSIKVFTQTTAQNQRRVEAITPQLQSVIQTPITHASLLSINDLAAKLASAKDHELTTLGIKNFEKIEATTSSVSAQVKINIFCTDDTSSKGKTTQVKAEQKPGTEGVTYTMKADMNKNERQMTIEKICKVAVETAKPGTEFKIPNQDPTQKAPIEAALEKALGAKYPETYVKGQLKVPEAPKITNALRI